MTADNNQTQPDSFGAMIFGELRLIHEYVEQIPGMVHRMDAAEGILSTMDHRLEALEDGQERLTAAVLTHLEELGNHEQRIEALERKAG